MASISAGTRNLKFMQRGTQLPPNPSTSHTSRAIPSTSQATPNNRPSTSVASTIPAGKSEEEEQWVLPTRRRALMKGKGKPANDLSSQRSSTQPRVVVTSESSYLAFVGQPSHSGDQDSQSSDEDMDSSRVIPSGGRLTFGALPSKQTVSIYGGGGEGLSLACAMSLTILQKAGYVDR